jgi:hypothetical protein
LKLLKPHISYSSHFQQLCSQVIETRIKNTDSIVYRSDLARRIVGPSLTFLLPKGVQIRTMQIIGSFILVNGTIALFKNYDLDRQVEAYASQMVKQPAKAN